MACKPLTNLLLLKMVLLSYAYEHHWKEQSMTIHLGDHSKALHLRKIINENKEGSCDYTDLPINLGYKAC